MDEVKHKKEDEPQNLKLKSKSFIYSRTTPSVKTNINFHDSTNSLGGPGSVVGIATAYGLDGPGIESRWGRDFPHLSRPALRPNQPPVQWVPDLSRG
jgi:hypothetical protein